MVGIASLGLAALLIPGAAKPKPHPPLSWSVTPVAVVRTAADILDPDRKPYLHWLDNRAGLLLLLRFNGPKTIRAFTHVRIIHAGINTGLNLRVLSPAGEPISRYPREIFVFSSTMEADRNTAGTPPILMATRPATPGLGFWSSSRVMCGKSFVGNFTAPSRIV